MAYAFQDDMIGLPGMRAVDTAPRGPALPGMLAHAVDPVLGGGEFLYMTGVAGTVVGSLVTYNQLTPATALAVTGVKGGQAVAVAMAAIGAGQWGWYQITGNALIAKTAGAAISAASSVAVSATGGQVAASAGGGVAGSLENALSNSAALSADTLVNVEISRAMVN